MKPKFTIGDIVDNGKAIGGVKEIEKLPGGYWYNADWEIKDKSWCKNWDYQEMKIYKRAFFAEENLCLTKKEVNHALST